MTELSECFCLDLSDSFTGDTELLTHLFKGAASSVIKTKAELDNVLFSGGECAELTLDHLAAHCSRSRICGSGGLIIGDKVAKMAVFLFTDRSFERYGLLRDLKDLANLICAHTHLLAKLISGRLTAVFLKELTLIS
jgi:hypothetical protein